jgi:hypothetical protein
MLTPKRGERQICACATSAIIVGLVGLPAHASSGLSSGESAFRAGRLGGIGRLGFARLVPPGLVLFWIGEVP